MYDIIIVGGGIAGLYAAYKMKQRNPNAKLLILEQNERSKIGGRAGTYSFHGVDVNIGAGVGRKEKDVLLNKLLKELDVDTHDFVHSPTYSSTIVPICNVYKTFHKLKQWFKKDPRNVSFQAFAQKYLSKEEYDHFVTCSGYSDYEKEEARSTFSDYGFDDNYKKWTAVSIPWKQLVENLIKHVGGKKIVCGQYVSKILPKSEGRVSTQFDVITQDHVYTTSNVILATTIESLLKLVPSEQKTLYRQIHGQPFLRIYAKMSKKSLAIMCEKVSGTVIVPGVLQKVISMNAEKGIYMIAYSDNQNAVKLKGHIENTSRNRDYFARLMEKALGLEKQSLGVDDMVAFYWSVGTHYYEPLGVGFKRRSEFLDEIRYPMKGMYVVGEMVSTNQGWTEGALESVEEIL